MRPFVTILRPLVTYKLACCCRRECCRNSCVLCFQSETRLEPEVISGRALRKTLQILPRTAGRNDDVEATRNSSGDESLDCHTVQLRARHPPWIKHFDGRQTRDLAATSSAWMATLLDSLHFRLVDRGDIPPSNARPPPPPQCFVYVLDSDLQLTYSTSTSDFSFRQETGNGCSAPIVSQLTNAVEPPAPCSNLPDLHSSSSTSLRSAIDGCPRPHRRNKFSVGSSPQSVAGRSGDLQSPPTAARHRLRRKLSTARSLSAVMTSSAMSRDVDEPPMTRGPPPAPPLPARREKPPPSSARVQAEPEQSSVLPVGRTASSAGQRQCASGTGKDEVDDELSYTVDVGGVSILDYVMQAASSVNVSRGVTNDVSSDVTNDAGAISKQQQKRRRFDDDGNSTADSDHEEPTTRSAVDIISSTVSHSRFLVSNFTYTVLIRSIAI